MKNTWFDIKDSQYYKINKNGDVISLERTNTWKHHGKQGLRIKKELILKKIRLSTGYDAVTIIKGDKLRQVSLHRLIAETFIPNPENKPHVNHINGIKNDNRIENLEWCTSSENGLHAYRVLGIPKTGLGKFGKDSNKSRPVVQLDLLGNIIRKWDCASDAVREYGFDSGSITKCCQNKQSQHKNYKWKYGAKRKKKN